MGDELTARPMNVVVLGATGSIGRGTLDVIGASGGRLRAFALAAQSKWEPLVEQALQYRPRFAILDDREAAERAGGALKGSGVEVLCGVEDLVRVVQLPEVDRVVSAVVGAAGLHGTWAAVEAGKTVALANKETLVVAGSLIMGLARRTGATLLPVDSEHSAIFQALRSGEPSEVKRIILTSSGGPFRGRTREALAAVTIDEALDHPTWRMGPKITVDSATLMNKALEVIEARWLFDVEPDRIEVVVHPESVVHSMVEFVDGSVIAQLSPPDMRLPIQYALTYPERCAGPNRIMDWTRAFSLRFEPPDRATFPCLDLGFEAVRAGGTAPAALNAANEQAVARFLAGEIAFLDIPRALRAALDQHPFDPQPTLDALWRVDRRAREEVARWTP